MDVNSRLLLSLLIVLLLCFFFYDIYQKKIQQKLLNVVLSIAKEDIISIEIRNNKQIKLTPDEIKYFKKQLLNTNDNILEGHNTPIYEFIIVIKTKKGQKYKFFASIHEKDMSDLYLSYNFYQKGNKGSSWRFFKLPIKVPMLGNLIINKLR